MLPYVILWIAVMIIMIAVEAVTVGLVSIWFAGGALVSMLAAMLGGGIWLQLILFLLVSTGLLICLWPIRNRFLKRDIQATNADRVIGMTAIVTEDVNNIYSVGAVQVDGKIWTARSENGDVFRAGELVQVVRIEGVKLIVSANPEVSISK